MTRAALIRQQPLGLTVPNSVSIIGVDGVGSWIAHFLALAGVPVLTLWDGDEVSEHNLNRLPYGAEFVNVRKASAMQYFLARIVPDCHTSAMGNWTPDLAASMPVPDWIVAATDTWSSRREVFQWSHLCLVCGSPACQEDHYRPITQYIEASSEGEFGGITGEPAMFATEDEVNPGYASVPVHVGPCVMAAALACYHILHNTNPGVSAIRMGWDTNRFITQQS